MYWIKVLVLTAISIPIALVSESSVIEWLPPWVPVGFTLSSSTLLLVLLASIGRLADAASTVFALSAPFLAESAPSLGPSPHPNTLWKLVIIQIGVITAGSLLAIWFIGGYPLRIILLVITLVSFAAAISNTILSLSAKSRIVSEHYRNIQLANQEEEKEEAKIAMRDTLSRLQQALKTEDDWNQYEDEMTEKKLEESGITFSGIQGVGETKQEWLRQHRHLVETELQSWADAQKMVDTLEKVLNGKYSFERVLNGKYTYSQKADLWAPLAYNMTALLAFSILTAARLIAYIFALPLATLLVALICRYLPI
ncbi:hypothetical protein ACFLTB_03885 [Chloroflexota bacterium]